MNVFSDIIRSRQNPVVKWAASLSDKKNRECERSFIAEGEKLCFEAAKAALSVSHIFVSESKKDKLISRIEAAFSADMYKMTKLICL